MSKKCNSPGESPGLVVLLAVFFPKFDKKIAKCNSPGGGKTGGSCTKNWKIGIEGKLQKKLSS